MYKKLFGTLVPIDFFNNCSKHHECNGAYALGQQIMPKK